MSDPSASRNDDAAVPGAANDPFATSGVAEPAARAPLGRCGDYELVEEMAHGGMGVVYRARQAGLDRDVALKMILAGQLASPQQIKRFHVEAEAAAQLDHPGIVPIYDVGTCQDRHYFTMKLIEGGSLAQNLEPFRGEPRLAAQLLCGIARAVHHAHQRGILHRDLKPANILLTREGAGWQPHITDFGLAKRLNADSEVTQTGAILGTPSYMAPEQTSGRKEDVTTLVDVYSLGAVLYELLTGLAPFRGATAWETVERVREEKIVPPSRLVLVERGLESICLKCLEKEPHQRYSSAGALAEDLENWLEGRSIQARPFSPARLVWNWLTTNIKTAVWLVIIGVVCGGLGTLLVAVDVIWDYLVRVHDVYQHFPSVPGPWLAVSRPPPFRLNWLPVLGFGLLSLPGFLSVMVARPKDVWSDVGIGLVTGGIAGVAAYMVAVSWITTAVHFRPSVEDVQQLGRAADEHSTQPLLARFPDLRAAPPDERGYLFARKIAVDGFLHSIHSTWLGMCYAMGIALCTVVLQALAAGSMLRRQRGASELVLAYLELSVVYVWSFTSLFFVFFRASGKLREPGAVFASNVASASAILGLLAIVCVPVVSQFAMRRLGWPVRLCLYLVLGGVTLRHAFDPDEPFTLLFAATSVLVLGTLGAAHVQRRREAVATRASAA